jgi:hypothetical protein
MKNIIRKIKRWIYKQRDHGELLLNHSAFGKFRVRYPDGEISQPFSWKAAKDYRDIFGGEIIDNF